MDKKKYLIAIDLDDTTLQDLRTLNDDNIIALKAAAAAGHKVMIATARPYCLTKPHYEKLALDTPIALCNGADIVHYGDSNFSAEQNYIPVDTAQKIYSSIPAACLKRVWIENNDDLYATGLHRGSSYFDEVYDKSNVHEIDIENLPSIAIGRLFIWLKDDERFAETIQTLQGIDGINLYYRKWDKQGSDVLCSIQSDQADKWFAVRCVAEYYQIPIENTIAFGDEMNDLLMLKHAGMGFAMCNGNKELIQTIGRVTRAPHSHGGVGRELDRLLQLGLFKD